VTEFLSRIEFEQALRKTGEERYHDRHVFHRLLHEGSLNEGQVQAWVLNRFYYQKSIPLKDASLMGRADDIALRREWIGRIVDHDGSAPGEGGIARWLILAKAFCPAQDSRATPMCISCARKASWRPWRPR
jgi:pyrroloquinoline-quinone synthase